MHWVFFGSSEFSIYVLDELLLHGIKPSLIITTPDKPKGRKLIPTPTPVKVWGQNNGIEVLDPNSLRNNPDLVYKLTSNNYELFLVASYGKIIPKEIFEIPEHKTLNIHPSLLPKYRGASPIQSQILNDERSIGVTLMQIEEAMDSGPILIQKKIEQSDITIGRVELEKILAKEGARLFAHVLPEWLALGINPIMQNEAEATYCSKISKEDGLINLEDHPYKNFLKVKALEEWPLTYFFHNGKRIKIIDAYMQNGKLQITKVTPEGRSEMTYEDFLRGERG